MDSVTFAILGAALAALSIIVAIALGIPQLLWTRRQTRIAEAAHAIAKREVHIDVLARIRQEKKVRVAYVHYPPFAIAPPDDAGSPSGLYVDLIREFLARQGVQVEFIQIRFSGAVKSVVDREFDIVLSIFQTPRRSRLVDFCAFMHSVSVSGVTRRQEERISSQSDLSSNKLTFVVCKEEIGHEILEDQMKIPAARVIVVDTGNVADIIQFVASKCADIAIADSLSCQHGLAARGAATPKLKPVLRRRPLYLCPNGVMIARGQSALSDWLDRGLKDLLAEPGFKGAELLILDEYVGIISKL